MAKSEPANKQSAAIHGDRTARFPDRGAVIGAAIQVSAGTRKVWRDTLCTDSCGKCAQLSAGARRCLQECNERLDGGCAFCTVHAVCRTWSKLAIFGRPAIATDPPFAYSRTQWLYLLATAVMMISLVIIAGPSAALLRYGQRNFDNPVMMVAGMLLVAGLILFAIGFVRLAFVFPAIAIRKYAGISAAWKQTRGNIERLAAIVVLSYAPYYVVRQILDSLIGYHPPGLAAATGDVWICC